MAERGSRKRTFAAASGDAEPCGTDPRKRAFVESAIRHDGDVTAGGTAVYGQQTFSGTTHVGMVDFFPLKSFVLSCS